MKIAVVIGTRPEIIRMSPAIKYLRKIGQSFFIVHTGQHYDYEMDSVFFKDLGLSKPKYNLGVGSGTHADQTYKMIVRIEKILRKEKPDITIVYGDTNSTLAGALASAKLQIPVVHMEAGCRSFDMKMPEEINRICVDHISRLLFPPDKNAYKNLINEGISKSKIYLYGNTHMDACLENYKFAKKKSKILNKLGLEGEYALLTLHRQENVDNKKKLEKILRALQSIDTPIVFPIHPRTKKMVNKFGLNRLLEKFIVIKPVGYIDFVMLLGNSKLVFTDSGGIQVEANILGKPCVVLRDTTAWMRELRGMSAIVSDKKELILRAYKSVGKCKKRKLNYSKHKGSSKKIIDRCIKLHKKKPLKMWKIEMVK